MIGHLRGTLYAVHDDHIILDVHGVGYRLYLHNRLNSSLPKLGESCTFVIATVVREDALQLFAFADQLELKLFHLLTSVSGIGCKQAVHLMSAFVPHVLMRAIAEADSGLLKTVKGIGHKTAEKIILELKAPTAKLLDSTALTERVAPSSGTLRQDLVAALLKLGYRRPQIEGVIERLNLDADTSIEDAVREALKVVGGSAI